jgi:histidine triad (HIT) family protein
VDGCVFCDIVRGAAPAYVVYRGERAAVFLDKFPVERGHALIVPVEHYENLLEVPDDVLCELARLVKAVAAAQFKALGARGVRVVQNNGAVAGQVVLHLHFHAIPFYGSSLRGRRPLDPREGEEVSKLLAEAISQRRSIEA